MDRDTKGRFRKKEGDEDENTVGFFERVPTLKIIILLVLVLWLLASMIPHPETIKWKMCDMICEDTSPSPPPTGNSTTEKNSTDAVKKKAYY